MAINKVGRYIPDEYANKYGVYEGEFARRDSYTRAAGKVVAVQPGESKLLGSIREAIEKVGLKDGMTISFHHHFREGDRVMNTL